MVTYSTKNKKIKLSLIGYDEPNNGRELHIIKVEEEGIDITKKLEPNWNRILYNLDNFEFCTEDSRFCFFPFESGGVLYDTQDKSITSLKYTAILPAYRWFLGNKFSQNQLIVLFNRLIQVVNLSSMEVKNFESSENERFESVEPKGEGIEVLVKTLITIENGTSQPIEKRILY